MQAAQGAPRPSYLLNLTDPGPRPGHDVRFSACGNLIIDLELGNEAAKEDEQTLCRRIGATFLGDRA